MPWCARCGTGLSQMEMNEGYAGSRGSGLDRPVPARRPAGRVAPRLDDHAVDADLERRRGGRANLRYVRVRQGDDEFWLGKGTLQAALAGPFEVLEEVAGTDLVGWRYAGPFDDLPAVRAAFAAGTATTRTHPYEHRVVAWAEVGEDEGTGIVHIAPGCGAEDFQLGKSLGLPVIAPLDESGIVVDGFGSLSGRDVRDVADPIIEHLKREAGSIDSRPSATATRIAGAATRRSCSASSTSGTSAWVRSTTSRARR